VKRVGTCKVGEAPSEPGMARWPAKIPVLNYADTPIRRPFLPQCECLGISAPLLPTRKSKSTPWSACST
jgi:hypothetical protein